MIEMRKTTLIHLGVNMYLDSDTNYHLIGACTFFSDDTLKIMGYNYRNLFPNRNNPILVYAKENAKLSNAVLFGKVYFDSGNDYKYKFIHPEIINELLSISEAENIYPELFI